MFKSNFKTAIVAIILLFLPFNYALAAYNANISGTVTEVSTYGGGLVLFSLSSMPTTGGCNRTFFAFSPATIADQESRSHMLATLMVAQATGKSVSVGYDSVGTFLR